MNSINFSKIFFHTFVFSFFCIPVLVLAQPIGLENPIGVDSISGLIRIVVKVIRYIAIPFVVIMIMYAGYLFLAADVKALGGQGIEQAKKTLNWVLIGAFVILSAEVIAIVIENTLKSIR